MVWQRTCVKPRECRCGFDRNGNLLHESSWHVAVCKCDATQQHQWMLEEIQRQEIERSTVTVGACVEDGYTRRTNDPQALAIYYVVDGGYMVLYGAI